MRSHPLTVMCSYNKLNGIHASEHVWLLDEVLRCGWNFDGAVISDWGTTNDRVASLKAGLDLDMPGNAGILGCAGARCCFKRPTG